MCSYQIGACSVLKPIERLVTKSVVLWPCRAYPAAAKTPSYAAAKSAVSRSRHAAECAAARSASSAVG
jgi:hypothetical protein